MSSVDRPFLNETLEADNTNEAFEQADQSAGLKIHLMESHVLDTKKFAGLVL
jgi:hypothetical protein